MELIARAPLARSGHLLGKAVGMELKHIQTEAPVGPYSLDILAEEVNKGVRVAIENQLGWTNFQHLAQILTYAAGRDAHIAIWVAPEFRYESAQVLNWLNEWTSKKVGFYGVRFDVGDSADETTFHKVVYPGGWNKDITLPPELPPPPHLKQHDDFFQPLITKLLGEDFADSVRQRFGYADRFFPSRLHPATGYTVSFYRNSAWASLHIETSDKDLTNRIFDALKAQQESIQSCLEAETEWDWDRRDREMFSYINIKKGRLDRRLAGEAGRDQSLDAGAASQAEEGARSSPGAGLEGAATRRRGTCRSLDVLCRKPSLPSQGRPAPAWD